MTYLIAYGIALAVVTFAVSVVFWLVTDLLLNDTVNRIIEDVEELLR